MNSATFPNIRYNEETNKLTGIKLDPQMSKKATNEKTTNNKPSKPVMFVVNSSNSDVKTVVTAPVAAKIDEDAQPSSSLVSPPQALSISINNQPSALAMPLLTPPSPRAPLVGPTITSQPTLPISAPVEAITFPPSDAFVKEDSKRQLTKQFFKSPPSFILKPILFLR